jgi:hypothetical protein
LGGPRCLWHQTAPTGCGQHHRCGRGPIAREFEGVFAVPVDRAKTDQREGAKMRGRHCLEWGLRLLTVLLLFGTGEARADAVPPDQYSCDGLGKQAGDACTTADGRPGLCQMSDDCLGKDLAHWDRDASTRPPVTTYACPKCVAVPDDSACSIGSSSPSHRFAPWTLAAAFSLLFLARRHRRQK